VTVERGSRSRPVSFVYIVKDERCNKRDIIIVVVAVLLRGAVGVVREVVGLYVPREEDRWLGFWKV
jgi:hypothetical protein